MTHPTDPTNPTTPPWLQPWERAQFRTYGGVLRTRAATRPAPIPPTLAGHPALAPWTTRSAAERAEKLGSISLLDVLDALLIGAAPTTKREARAMIERAGISAWLNCAAESKGLRAAVERTGAHYVKLSWLPGDHGEPPADDWLSALDFTSRAFDEAQAGDAGKAGKPRIMISSAGGMHRSAHLAAFLVAALTGKDLPTAWTLVKQANPQVEQQPALYASADRALGILRTHAPRS